MQLLGTLQNHMAVQQLQLRQSTHSMNSSSSRVAAMSYDSAGCAWSLVNSARITAYCCTESRIACHQVTT